MRWRKIYAICNLILINFGEKTVRIKKLLRHPATGENLVGGIASKITRKNVLFHDEVHYDCDQETRESQPGYQLD